LTGATFRPDLRPNDRFAGNGGTVRIRAALITGGAVGDILMDVNIGNELVESSGAVSLEPAANRGIDNFTPAIEETGVAADVIDVRFRNTNAATRSVAYFIEIQNA